MGVNKSEEQPRIPQQRESNGSPAGTHHSSQHPSTSIPQLSCHHWKSTPAIRHVEEKEHSFEKQQK